MDRGTWQDMVHRVTESWTWLNDLAHMHRNPRKVREVRLAPWCVLLPRKRIQEASLTRRSFPPPCSPPLRESPLSVLDHLVTFIPTHSSPPVLDLSVSLHKIHHMNCSPLFHLQVTLFYQAIGADATQSFNGQDIEPGTWAPQDLKSELKYSEKGFFRQWLRCSQEATISKRWTGVKRRTWALKERAREWLEDQQATKQ